MDSVLEKQLKDYISRLSRPAMVMDDNFMCVLSNRSDLLPTNRTAVFMFEKLMTLPLKSEHINMAVLDGVSYCVRVVPLPPNGLNICEFFNYRALLNIAENTDFCERLLPLISNMEFNTAALWKIHDTLKDKFENDGLIEYYGLTASFARHLTSLNSLTRNIIEYLNMLLYDPLTVKPLNIADLLMSMIDRCNSLIEPTNRYINCLIDDPEIYIDADHRHAVAALVNAVQNSLIYSPRDSVPVVTLTEDTSNRSMTLRIVNKTIVDPGKESMNTDYFRSVGSRPGCGIPILRRFAHLTGGQFTIDSNDSSVEMKMTIPTLPKDLVYGNKAVLRCNVYVHYETGIPDLISLMMNEVIALFSA